MKPDTLLLACMALFTALLAYGIIEFMFTYSLTFLLLAVFGFGGYWVVAATITSVSKGMLVDERESSETLSDGT